MEKLHQEICLDSLAFGGQWGRCFPLIFRKTGLNFTPVPIEPEKDGFTEFFSSGGMSGKGKRAWDGLVFLRVKALKNQ